jgi:hypothetical protein
LPLSFGASLRLGIPSLRSCSVGPPRPAIHGLTRLPRHPAEVPTAQNLHSASRGGGNREKQKRGELTLDLFGEKPKPYTDLLWERACPRWRPDRRREICGCVTSKRSQPRCTRQLLQGWGEDRVRIKPGRPVGRLPVGAGLSDRRIAAKASDQPARFRISSHSNCGSQPAGDAACRSTQILRMFHIQKIAASLHSTAPTEIPRGRACSHQTRPAGRPPRALLRCPPPREAERRFCAVGNPAGCRVSRVRPWMAGRGAPTEQDRSEGMPSLGEAPNDRGKSAWLLGAFPSNPP